MITREGAVDSRGYSVEDFLTGVLIGTRLNGVQNLGSHFVVIEGLEEAVRKADELKIPLGFRQITNLHIGNVVGQMTHVVADASCAGGRSIVLNLPADKARDYLIRTIGVSYTGRSYIRDFEQLGLVFKEVSEKINV